MHLGLPIFSLLSLCPISQQLPLALTAGLGSPNTQHIKPLPTSLWIWSCLCRNVGLFVSSRSVSSFVLLVFFWFSLLLPARIRPVSPSSWCTEFSLHEGTLFSSNSHPCCHEMAATAYTQQEILCALFLWKENKFKRKYPSLFFPC